MGKGSSKRQAKARKKRSSKQVSAAESYISRWAFLPTRSVHSISSSLSSESGHAMPEQVLGNCPVFDFHTHSTCSDGMLSPVELLERAHSNGVQVLALTDHDTMMGVPAALEAACRHGIRLIPGVEISAKYGGRMSAGSVHILGYYSCCGPSRSRELEDCLARIREGRYHRARTMLDKLRMLRKPIKWERVLAIAGDDVAPGRVHVARALVEAGHVQSLQEAFSKYLYDGGPAYATGYELAAEEAVHLVCRTGGVSVLAHPWCLTDPLHVVKRLKAAGLHAMEVYRSDGKATSYADLADAYQLVKLGGSDFHGRGDPNETGLGKVPLPMLAVHEFLRVAEPIWCTAIRDIVQAFAKETSEKRLGEIADSKNCLGESQSFRGDISLVYLLEDGFSNTFLKLSPWLTEGEKVVVIDEVSQLNLSYKVVLEEEKEILFVSHHVYP